jgi:hypothetical protein
MSALGLLWSPFLLAIPLFLGAVAALVFKASVGGMHGTTCAASSKLGRIRMRVRTGLLYLLQPAARLGGRLRFGLSPWRRRSAPHLGLPIPRTHSIWSEQWRAPDERVRRLEKSLRRIGGVVFSGGDYERWDLYVRGGMLGSMRLRVAVEEHGAGRQFVRIRSWPRFSRIGAAVVFGLAALGVGAALDGAWAAAAVLAGGALLIIASMLQDCATAAGVLRIALNEETEHAARETARSEEPTARPEPRLAGNTISPAVEVPHAGNGSVNGFPVSRGNGTTLPSSLNLTERGFNVAEREE